MKQHLIAGLVCLMAGPALAQNSPEPQHAAPDTVVPGAKTPPPAYSPGGLPRTPTYSSIEGQPIDSRTPEKKIDTRQFPEQTRAPYHKTADFKATVMTAALQAPWASALLPDGAVLVTERLPGALRIVGKDGSLSPPLTGLEALHVATPETGLLDVVLDPAFAANHTIYFTFFEYFDRTVGNTAIARAVLDEKSGAIRNVKVLLKTLPLLPNDQNLAAGTKTGGRLAIGPDGFLYAAIGDRDNAGSRPWGVAQLLDTHLGKILRLTKDGKPAPGNPFAHVAGARPEIWAIGFRSPEGLAFDASGNLWETEHGPRGGDEFNHVEKGRNYGWPIITHGNDYSAKPVGDDMVAKPGLEQPVYYWSPSTAPSGLAYYNGTLFPTWKNSFFAGMLNGRLLSHLTMGHGKVVGEEPYLTELNSRIRDVRVGADGAVYVLTDSGGSSITDTTPSTSKLIRLTPQ